MSKQLAVYDTIDRRIYGLDPANAGGIPLPAFQVGNVIPASGSLVGEGYLHRTTGIPYIWDGSNWVEVALPVIVRVADDNAALNDPLPDGTVILSEATGNIWTVETGGGRLSLGLRVYPTQASLNADTPPNGTLAFATDTGEFSVRTGGAWAALAHQGVTVGTAAPTTPVTGDLWLDTSANKLKFYSGTGWVEVGGGAAVTSSMPPNPQDGDLWWQPSVERMRVRQGGSWHWSEPSATRFASWVVNNQTLFDFPADQKPEKYVRLRGMMFNGNSSRMMLIGKRGGAWIDWDGLVNQGFCLEANHQGSNVSYAAPDDWAESNAGMYLHLLGLSANVPMILDLRIDFIGGSEPIMTSRFVGKSGSVAFTSTIDCSVHQGAWNTRMSSIGLKGNGGGLFQGRMMVEWA
jgi:hypothetical protein